MNVEELLNSGMGQNLVSSISSQLGMNQQEASSAINAAIPAILAGLTKNAQTPQGAESLNNALENKHDGSLLDNLSGLLQGNIGDLQNDGNGILGHIFGNNQSAVEQGISQKTGISVSKIAPLLALLAPIVMSYLGKEKRQTNTGAGGLGGLLGGLLGGATKSSSAGGGIMGMLGGILDKNKDGNVIDDVLGMFGGKK